MAHIRIEYDDYVEDVIEKVNIALKPKNLKFVYSTPKSGDGFVIYYLLEMVK